MVSIARHFGEYLKSDERILGDSDFVEEVLSASREKMEEMSLYHEKGMDLRWLAQRVGEVLQIDPSEIWKPGKKAPTVQARSLLCYWATRELRMTAEAISKELKLSESGVIRAAQRGEQLVQANGWRLVR